MADREHATDELLARALAAGDPDALAQVYDRHGGLVYSLSLRLLRNTHDAEELLHDVFLQLWRKARTIDLRRGSVAAFLVTVTRNRCIDRLRSRSARPATASLPETDTTSAGGPSPAFTASLTEARATIRAAMSMLPEAEHRVLRLAYFDGLSHSQIAERTGSPLGTVKGRARNGLRRLRELLPAGLEALA